MYPAPNIANKKGQIIAIQPFATKRLWTEPSRREQILAHASIPFKSPFAAGKTPVSREPRQWLPVRVVGKREIQALTDRPSPWPVAPTHGAGCHRKRCRDGKVSGGDLVP